MLYHPPICVSFFGHAIVQLWWRGPGALPPNDQTQDPNQWWVNYWGNQTQWQDAVGRRNEGTGFLNRQWGLDGPGFGIPGDHFSTQFERTVHFDCGIYQLNLQSDDGSRLFIDGTKIPKFDNWQTGVWNTTDDITFQKGDHTLKVDYFENTGSANVYLDWNLVSISPCGDSNSDGKVDLVDYVIWLNHYGLTGAGGPSIGDFNKDGVVDLIDYVIWLNNYGRYMVNAANLSGMVNPITPAQNKAEIFFDPAEASLSSEKTFTLMVDAKSYQIAGIQVEVTFNPMLVNLAGEIQTTSKLGNVIKKTSKDEANATGQISIAIARSANDQPLTGIFEVAQIPFVDITGKSVLTTDLSLVDQEVQIVDVDTNAIPFESRSAIINPPKNYWPIIIK